VADAPLVLADLVLYPAEVAALLCGELERAGLPEHRDDPHLTDAFLLAASLHQVLEDYLERDVGSLAAASRRVAKLGASGTGTASAVLGAAAATALGVAWRSAAGRRAGRVEALTGSLLRSLADAVVAGVLAEAPRPAFRAAHADPERLAALAAAVRDALPSLPRGLSRRPPRPPTCFRVLDEEPEDVVRLVEAVVEDGLEGRGALVVGLRTSGSYLAPLGAAALRAAGWQAESATMRPGRPLRPSASNRLARACAEASPIVVMDDPPRTGLALLRALEQLVEAGAEPSQLVVAVGLLGDALPEPLRALPAPLAGVRTVVLPFPAWAVHDRVRRAAQRLPALVGERAGPHGRPHAGEPRGGERGGEVLLDPVPARRGHVVVRAEVAPEGSLPEAMFAIEGTGLGYLGRDAWAIAEALDGHVPRVFGVEAGLLVREWLPETARCSALQAQSDLAGFAKAVAAYVAHRRERLAVERDRSLDLRGWGPVWEAAAGRLAEAFGRLAPLARVLTPAAAKRLLATGHPSLVDGNSVPGAFFRRAPGAPTGPPGPQAASEGVDGARGPAVCKVGFAGAAFSNRDLYGYDALLDLAQTAAALEQEGVEATAALVREYEQASGERVDAPRLLLYLLDFHERALSELRGGLRGAEAALRPELARRQAAVLEAEAKAVRETLADLLLGDVDPPQDGPLAVLDVDGVLETRWLEVPVPAPSGLLAVRALLRHGYRVVLATGRPLPSVAARCRAYRAAGAVAEYGAAVVVASRTGTLVGPEAQAALRALDQAVAACPEVVADPAPVATRRLYGLGRDGHLRGVPGSTLTELLDACGAGARLGVVSVTTQTDLVPLGVDKARGLEALRALLSQPRPTAWPAPGPEGGGAGAGPPGAGSSGPEGSSAREHRSAGLPSGGGGEEDEIAFAMGDSEADRPVLERAALAFVPKDAPSGLDAVACRTREPAQAGLFVAVGKLIGHPPGRCARCRRPPPSAAERTLATVLDAVAGGRVQRARQLLRLAAVLAPDAASALPGLAGRPGADRSRRARSRPMVS
jgi:hypothetical protein